MKFIVFLLLSLSLIDNLSAQIAIGKSTINTQNTILDFTDDASNVKGIILSTVDNIPSNPVNGTFIFDKNDKKIKVYENNIWKDLTDTGSNSAIVTNSSEDIGLGVTIGNQNTSINGVLVLDSENKSMILPKIYKPELNVPSPYPGMMCYDTSSKSLAIYDGLNWNYWK